MNLNQVSICTTKPIETAVFFEKLGLKIIVDSLPRYARYECPEGDATLSIHITDQDPPASPIVLYFECEDLDATVADLKSKGLRFEPSPTDQDWLWREAYLLDPNGSRVCLFHAGDNRKNPPWRVK